MDLNVNWREVARRVKELRGLKRQGPFGAPYKLTQSQISDIEREKVRRPSAAMMDSLRAMLGSDLSGAARSLPVSKSSGARGDDHIVETGGLKGPERAEFVDALGRIARLWHRGGDVRRQVKEAIDLLEARNPEADPPRKRRA